MHVGNPNVRVAALCCILWAGASWAIVNIQGTVTDSSTGSGIQGAVVTLVKAGLKDTTGSSGAFQLMGDVSTLSGSPVVRNDFALRQVAGNAFLLRNDRSQRIRVTVMTVQGMTAARLHDDAIAGGEYLMRAPDLAPGCYLLVAETPSGRRSVPFLIDMRGVGGQSGSGDRAGSTGLAKAAVFADTISVAKAGYATKRVAVTDSVVSNLQIRMRASTVPSGMVLIPAKNKTFMMGAKSGEGYDDEYPQHSVTLTHDFYMDETEVTQGQWTAMYPGNNPSSAKNNNYPVNNVSWFDAILYCNKRSKQEGRDTVYSYTGGSSTPSTATYGSNGGSRAADFDNTQLTGLQIHYNRSGYRLPTEAEWEFACRGGNADKYFFGGGNGPTYPTGSLLTSVNQYAWHNGNAGGTLHAVKSKSANPYGLYDITGGVWEWCNDWAINDGGAQGGYTSASAGTDPTGPTTGWFRNFRGGDWSYGSNACNSTFRSGKGTPNFKYIIPGFRTVLVVP